MNIYNEYLTFAKDIAKYAGKVMLKYFNQDNIEKYKNDNTIVTLVDTEINSYLINEVKNKYSNQIGFPEYFQLLHKGCAILKYPLQLYYNLLDKTIL